MSSTCRQYVPLIGSRPGELSEEEGRALNAHLADCSACQARLADEETLSGMLRDALLSKANERDFTGFSDDVLARIAEYRTRRSGGFLPWVRRHLAAAILSVLVPAFVALAVVVYLFAAEGEQAPLEVSAEDSTATIINTSDGPVVLFGDAEPEGS